MSTRTPPPAITSLAQAHALVADVRSHAADGDDEAASSVERRLHAGVLRAIGESDLSLAQELASLAASTASLEFRRC